ncbi:MAG: lycopene cyclase domain-containing protein [Cyclobacteriaceae bacterium]|nr:lycopene cyclase domain-containing protein [Cyclobacteriaceae bacterium]
MDFPSRFLYLFLDLASIAIPLAWSFEKKVRFFRDWKYLFPAIALTGLFFIIWDVVFTDWGVWGFNPTYLSGYYLLNLPVEEWLFFICIPYACVFTYRSLSYFIKKDLLQAASPIITKVLIFLLLLIGLIHFQNAYTFTTFISLALFLLWHLLVVKSPYLGRFYLAYLVILIPFFTVNGILTGSFIPNEVVWYDDQENLGIRMFTIPVEDTFYGMLLILMNVTIYEYLKHKGYRK